MDKNYIVSLTALLIALVSPVSFADRPAAVDESGDPVFVEDEVSNVDMRPAASDTTAEPAPAPAPRNVSTETQSSGDVLDMSNMEALPAAVRQLDFPRRGMTQDKVQNELGRPVEIVPAIGQPPISRWVYDDRVVYFEYSSVIHVVAR